MRSGRQIARLVAVMIAMIITSAAPSVVQAHEGHAHHEPAVAEVHVVAPELVAPSMWNSAALTAPPSFAVQTAAALAGSPAADDPGVADEARTGSLKAVPGAKGCCPGACRGSCCGTMACHGPGILSGPSTLPSRAFGHVKLMPSDIVVVSGIGPEAVRKPPRPLA
ncbi:hypothetical protein [Methylobacterium iners]|uniref:Cobalt-zinc-cadmium resistance protein n=1 Tax=Methylobacterium iners TaxID=418707 RepID=A0ABQ4RXP7_9HYPH|nr:hypothetical protein [Methylobacterium iners]GJD94484.1 hypothetical protein OCOJLMKI_1686 [Methylobacterium iners]